MKLYKDWGPNTTPRYEEIGGFCSKVVIELGYGKKFTISQGCPTTDLGDGYGSIEIDPGYDMLRIQGPKLKIQIVDKNTVDIL